ncbi:6-hydroxymethylpterin diphosphokinase MptE-like protein [Thermospira aquatica]|uniref:Motility associated factor glycosyltransferase family protein n=1 Tax=Thermospira aquatica TaxID=2828656 RepID=A0AAX3BER6_9SPIR|nr:6-hydroxymethylpterin diphosphokinase MptE-like protein [Thermospira aquatica]URA10760.1 motility associated factor glycosyltransferase family protein [Thermospira aquatica]
MQIEIGEEKFRFVKIEGRYLYSPYNPFREIERTFQNLPSVERPFFVVFGSAQGHVVEFLLNQGYEAKDIWVTEPHPDLEAWSREHIGFAMEGTLASRLILLNEEIFLSLNTFFTFQTFLHHYEIVLTQTIENIKVTAFFSKLWWINFVRNLSMVSQREVYKIPSHFTPYDIPILVTASGPSLTTLLESIFEWYQAGGKILACLSSWPTLASANIVPWGVVVSDAGVGNILHAQNLPHEVIVFASVYANSALLSSLPQRIVYYDIDKEESSPSFMLSQPSVVLDALTLAKRLFTGEIYIAGLDLGYTLRGTHARGNMVALRQELLCSRLYPVETEKIGFLKRKDIQQFNDHVWTTPSFQLIKQEIEKIFPDVHILHPIQPWKNPIRETLPIPSPLKREITFEKMGDVTPLLHKAKTYLETSNTTVYLREDLLEMPRETVKNYLLYKLLE